MLCGGDSAAKHNGKIHELVTLRLHVADSSSVNMNANEAVTYKARVLFKCKMHYGS